MKKITEDMMVFEVLDLNPDLEDVFLHHGLNCVGCPGSRSESLKQAADGHDVALSALLEDLNKANEL
jgi:hybrid cluster-associated redox disulfide protein